MVLHTAKWQPPAEVVRPPRPEENGRKTRRKAGWRTLSNAAAAGGYHATGT